MTEMTFRFGPTHPHPSLDEHLRVEVVDAGHPAWPAVRRRVARSARLMELDGRLSARQAVVAAFLDGRVVGHACFHVEPVRSPDGSPVVLARVDSRAVDAPFAGTAVEQVLRQMADSRTRTMGCHGFAPAVVAEPSPIAA